MRTVMTLLCVGALVAFFGPLVEGRHRSAERSVREYIDAIHSRDVDSALQVLEPSTRPDWRIFVEHQSGDSIRLQSVAVQRGSLFSHPRFWGTPQSVTLTAELTGKGGERWLATSHVMGRLDGERWFLATPPFGPDEAWLVPPES